MTPELLIAAVTGVAVALGILLTIVGWRPAPPRGGAPGTATATARLWARLRDLGMDPRAWRDPHGHWWAEWRWPLALEAGFLVWFLSGWPVAGAAVWAGVIGVPILLGAGRTARASIDRAEAIEAWSRRLADVLLTGVGLEQAVTATTDTCPEALRPYVAALAARLRAGWTTEASLRALADDLDDATADLVVATLVLGSRRRGPGLARTLTAVADSLADEVGMRRKVEAERAKPRATARAVTVVIVGVLVAGSLSGDYLRPYGTATGQVVLAALLAALAAALFALHRLARTPPTPRLLAAPTAASGTDDHVGVLA
jgi:Flp pilus assembly protein TadB